MNASEESGAVSSSKAIGDESGAGQNLKSIGEESGGGSSAKIVIIHKGTSDQNTKKINKKRKKTFENGLTRMMLRSR
jgi:hypothetical protein